MANEFIIRNGFISKSGSTVQNFLNVSGNTTSAAFVTIGGTELQFVKGDGTLDSNTYLTGVTDANISFSGTPNYVPVFDASSNLTDSPIYISGGSSNVGIGTTGPTEKLHVSGNTLMTGKVAASGATLTGLSNQGSEATALVIDSSGIVGTRELGSGAFVSSGSYLLDTTDTFTGVLTINGEIISTGNIYSQTNLLLDSNKRIVFDTDFDGFSFIENDFTNTYSHGINAMIHGGYPTGHHFIDGEDSTYTPVYASNFTATGTLQGTRLISTQTTGTAPFTVASTTVVPNLNADLLDGVQGSSFLRSDVADTKTSGNLIFNNDIRLQFGNTPNVDLRSFSGGDFGITTYISTGDPNIVFKRDASIQFTFNMPSGNFIATGEIRNLANKFYIGNSDTRTIIRDNNSGATIISQNQVGGGTLFFRPNNDVSPVGQATLEPSGNFIATGAIFSKNSMTIDNGLADGGSLSLRSLGYNSWEFDNFSGALRMFQGGTVKQTILENGNVGIGTSTPDYLFEVENPSGPGAFTTIANFKSGTDADNTGAQINVGMNSRGWFVRAGRNVGNVAISTMGQRESYGSFDYMTFKGGNIGIGTASPNELLEVAGSTGATIRITSTKNGTWTVGEELGALEFYGSDTSGAGANVKASIRVSDFNTFGAAHNMTFYTNGGTTEAERMRITATGNVSIGNTNDTYKLDVSGTCRFTGALRAEGNIQLASDASTIVNGNNASILRNNGSSTIISSQNNIMYFRPVGDASTTGQATLDTAGNFITTGAITSKNSMTIDNGLADGGSLSLFSLGHNSWQFDNFSGALRMFQGGTVKQTILENGNVGIGTTTPQSRIHVQNNSDNANIAMFKGFSTNINDVTTISVNNGFSTEYGKQVKIGAVAESASSNATGMALFTSPNSSTALERVRISSDGNVGIGTTSPAYKLDVTGTGRFTGDVTANSFIGIDGTRKIITDDATTTHTVVSSDSSVVRRFTSSSPITVTVNTDSLANIGESAEIDQYGTGLVTIAAGTATLRINALATLVSSGQYSRISIQKMTSTEYRVFGELALA